jgi:hypothetical protein
VNRQELAAVRDVIDALLRCPDHVRELLTQWLAPEARSKERTVPLIFSKPNGRDPHPPPIAPMGVNRPPNPLPTPTGKGPPPPRRAKARHGKPSSAKAAEQRLLTAMRESPGLSVAALAKAASASRSTTGERLRQLAARGAIDKDSEGHWRLMGEEGRLRRRRRADGGTGSRAPRGESARLRPLDPPAHGIRAARAPRIRDGALWLTSSRKLSPEGTALLPLKYREEAAYVRSRARQRPPGRQRLRAPRGHPPRRPSRTSTLRQAELSEAGKCLGNGRAALFERRSERGGQHVATIGFLD